MKGHLENLKQKPHNRVFVVNLEIFFEKIRAYHDMTPGSRGGNLKLWGNGKNKCFVPIFPVIFSVITAPYLREIMKFHSSTPRMNVTSHTHPPPHTHTHFILASVGVIRASLS